MTAGDGETRKKLIEAAKEEFIEKGYMNASLRSICKKAGVTTGALYFLFKDKDDLFEAVVSKPLIAIDTALKEHMNVEASTFADGYDMKESEGPDMEVSRYIINIMFTYKDECTLLLTKASGSKFENIKDSLITELEQSYRAMAVLMERTNGFNHVDDYTLHYMTHMQVDAFVYLLTHSKDLQEALAELPYIIRHMRGGWFSVFGAI